MGLTFQISERSRDPRLKVGTVVVTEDNTTVLAIGYNGDQQGGTNQPDSLEPGKSGFIHAEANALIKMNFGDPRNKKMYLTHSPCPVCARMIVNAGIKKVIYCEEYRDEKGLEILKSSGIDVEKCEMCMAD
jgi:dCMP deaminase